MHAEAEKLSTEAQVGGSGEWAQGSGDEDDDVSVFPAMSQAFGFCLRVGSKTLLKKRSDRVTFIWMVKKGELNCWAPGIDFLSKRQSQNLQTGYICFQTQVEKPGVLCLAVLIFSHRCDRCES